MVKMGATAMSDDIICLYCGKDMEMVDSTTSNIKTDRAHVGQHTGNIWFCEDCEAHFIEDFLAGGEVLPWVA